MIRTDSLVYLAGPYSSGPEVGVARMENVQMALLDAGIPAINPLLSHYLNRRHPRHYEVWMALDLALIARCDLVVRLRGESPGADREVARAQELGIPVIFPINDDYAVMDTIEAIQGISQVPQDATPVGKNT